MSHSHICCLVHVVFATAERRQTIPPDQQGKLHAYIGGIARENGIPALAVALHHKRSSFADEMNKFLAAHRVAGTPPQS